MTVQTRQRRLRSVRNDSPASGGPSKRAPGATLWGIAAGAVAVVTAAGLAVSMATGNNSTTSPSASAPSDSAPAVAEARGGSEDGVPVGYPRTEAGAKAAAANYTTISGGSTYLTDEKARRRAVSIMSASNAASATLKEADRSAGQAANELRGDNSKLDPRQAIARTGVLASHTLAFDIHNATLRLWTTTVRGSAAGHATPKTAFRTVTVNLVWEKDDWKIASTSSGSGPVAPVDVRQAANVTSDFATYAPGAADDPVFSGAAGTNGFPAPYAHDEHGARAAATSATMLYGDPRFFTNAEWRHTMLAATVAPSALKSVTADTDSTARLVTENRGLSQDGKTMDGEPLVTRTAVLATRSVSYSDQAASVELWTASVGGIAGKDETQRPQVAYLRMSVDLIWVDGTWKATSVTPAEPLVPSPPAAEQAAPATSFASMGGVSDAPALA